MTVGRIVLRAATATDDWFVVEMARHACVIEDWPLPAPDDEEVLEMLPWAGVVPIVADRSGTPVGAAWTYQGNPPLRRDAAGVPLPELCIAVAPGHDALCANVHVRNPAIRVYERKGFRGVGQGNGPLGLAMVKELR